MNTMPLIERFAKSTVSRDEVEADRRDRLTIVGAVSSVITEDAERWVLTTLVQQVDDDAPAPPAPPRPAPARPLAAPAPPAAAPVPAPAVAQVFGTDSLSPSGADKLASVTGLHGVARPAFWGRYFYAPGQTTSTGAHDPDHYSPREHAFLRANGIRVLPICRQTGHVGGTSAQAVTDADHNVAALFECFPPDYLAMAAPEVLLFLDVEEAATQPRLVPAYYVAWAARIAQQGAALSGGRVTLVPAAYTSRKANQSLTALKQAMDQGAPCAGIWIAQGGLGDRTPPPFSDATMLPAVPLACPTLACQYFLCADAAPPSENVDMSVCNPLHATMLLSRLIMPPPG